MPDDRGGDLTFEVLALDTEGFPTIKTEQNLLHSLLSNARLWHTPELRDDASLIRDGSLNIIVKAVSEDEEAFPSFESAFLIRATGPLDKLEPLRLPLVLHLEHQRLGCLYILKDDASESIACQLYPHLYRVENALRGYLIKFMTTRLGPRWWQVTATGELSKKVSLRKNNERVFADHIDNNAYLIDFGDLGKMIYAQSSGFTSKDDIVAKITEVEETPEAIRQLKAELQSNYQKFFKESFKEKGFQGKWEELEKIRHKVAHNNLFTQDDLDRGVSFANDLMTIIEEAAEGIEALVIQEEEKEAIKQSFVAQGYTFDVITEKKFLEELAKQEELSGRKGTFIGIAYFVKKHLGYQGYDYASSYDVAQRLEAQGKVEMYLMQNPYGEYPTTAIRSVSGQAPTKQSG